MKTSSKQVKKYIISFLLCCNVSAVLLVCYGQSLLYVLLYYNQPTNHSFHLPCISLAEDRRHTSASLNDVIVNLAWSLWHEMQVLMTYRWSLAVGDCCSCMKCQCWPPIWLHVD